MQDFEFHVPTHIIFGRETEKQTGPQIKALGGSRVLVVYGGGSAIRSGLLKRVEASLEQADLPYVLLGGVKPNPRVSLVRTGVELAREERLDFVLAVGGGSVIDTAKAIADSAAMGVDVWQLWTKEVELTASLPVGVVLTIPAAGSETSDSAVLTHDEEKKKRGLSSPFHRPRFAIMNPELVATLPEFQMACGVVDIMMHTMDRYFNPVTTNGLTDELAESILRTVIRCGKKAVEDRSDYENVSELMWAGSLSHNGLTGLGGKKDFAPHQLGHELSATFDAAHGATLSAVWPSWARYCLCADPARFARFGQKVWGLSAEGKTERELALEAIEANELFFRSLGMPISLSGLGCGIQSDQQLAGLADRCSYGNTRTIGTFRVLNREDMLKIYQMANH